MSCFTPFGKGHIALACANHGAVSYRDVRRALNLPASKEGKSNALIQNLRADGLLSRRTDGLHLTRLGREVLDELRQARSVEVSFGRMTERQEA